MSHFDFSDDPNPQDPIDISDTNDPNHASEIHADNDLNFVRHGSDHSNFDDNGMQVDITDQYIHFSGHSSEDEAPNDGNNHLGHQDISTLQQREDNSPEDSANHPAIDHTSHHHGSQINFKGYGGCSRCSCRAFEGYEYCCHNCGHNYGDHW